MADKYNCEGLTPTGKCPVCDINLWEPDNRPRVWPCGISGEKQCPFETKDEQAKIEYEMPVSLIGNGLAQID